MKTIVRIPILAILAGLLLACGPGPSPPDAASSAQPAEPEHATSRDFGDYVLYFNAIPTNTLTPEVAKTYNITRSANRAMVNVSLAKKVPGAANEPVGGDVTAQAVNLNGQFKDLTLREVRDGPAVYYIGDVPVGNEETLVITVDAIPAGTTRKLSVRFQRQFFGN